MSGRGALDHRPRPKGQVAGGRGTRVALLALLLAAFPYLAGFFAAPHGEVFLGALNNVGDTGQYLAALRQGADGHLLYVNQFTSLSVPPVLMYPLYTVTGFILAPVHLPVMLMYGLLRLVAAAILLAAVWRFCRTVCPHGPAPAYALAVFGGGLYLPVLLLSGVVRVPVAPVALTAPEFSVFATLLLSPHGALGLVAELWALGGYLLWRQARTRRHLVALAAGGLALGLCYPFGIPVLLAVVTVDTVVGWFAPHACGRAGRGEGLLALALLPALGVALYYALLFGRDRLWSGSNMLHLPPPDVALLAAAFGPLLALALPAAPRLCRAGGAGRLVVVWALVNPLLLLAPLPQAERLLTGWSVALALPGAVTLKRLTARWSHRWLGAIALSNVMMALLYLIVALRGANAAYYAPVAQQAAVSWLAAHAGPHDVVMASAGSGNLIVAGARCRVVAGQNYETFRWIEAQQDVLRYYSATASAAERRAIVRRHHITLVLFSPYERSLGPFVPRGRGYRLVYAAGPVRIFAVESV